MDITYFREGLEAISYAGESLGLEKVTLIENSLLVLQNENKFRAIYFWGRINGYENDYYISFGYEEDCLKDRKWFYSINGYQWILMPAPKKGNELTTIRCTEKFSGDPSEIFSIIIDSILDENQTITTDSEIRDLKEEDRLSSAIQMITKECALLPRGAIYKPADKIISKNPMFRGLNEFEATDFCNYQLFREPENNWLSNLTKRHNYNYSIDFLDDIQNEIGFAISLEKCGAEEIVIIKSLIWPGMKFYHKLHSEKHGFVYFGDGRKNFDLLFML